jgi:hypothetical protein
VATLPAMRVELFAAIEFADASRVRALSDDESA